MLSRSDSAELLEINMFLAQAFPRVDHFRGLEKVRQTVTKMPLEPLEPARVATGSLPQVNLFSTEPQDTE